MDRLRPLILFLEHRGSCTRIRIQTLGKVNSISSAAQYTDILGSITVHSLLPDTQFENSFDGDLKDWLEALVTLGRFKDSTYVNVGNAG